MNGETKLIFADWAKRLAKKDYEKLKEHPAIEDSALLTAKQFMRMVKEALK